MRKCTRREAVKIGLFIITFIIVSAIFIAIKELFQEISSTSKKIILEIIILKIRIISKTIYMAKRLFFLDFILN